MSDFMEEYAYLVTICAVIAVVAGSAIYTRSLQERTDAGVQAAAQAAEISETAPPAEVTPLPTIAPFSVRTDVFHPGYGWPVGGGVLRAFDEQTPVYWEQLGCWKAHTGLDVAGAAGESVVSGADGTVKKAVWDEMWGWRVTIEAGEREIDYAGLESCLLTVGEHVRQGQTIGTLLETIPCEAEIGTHLHMEMRRLGTLQDPEATLAAR